MKLTPKEFFDKHGFHDPYKTLENQTDQDLGMVRKPKRRNQPLLKILTLPGLFQVLHVNIPGRKRR